MFLTMHKLPEDWFSNITCAKLSLPMSQGGMNPKQYFKLIGIVDMLSSTRSFEMSLTNAWYTKNETIAILDAIFYYYTYLSDVVRQFQKNLMKIHNKEITRSMVCCLPPKDLARLTASNAPDTSTWQCRNRTRFYKPDIDVRMGSHHLHVDVTVIYLLTLSRRESWTDESQGSPSNSNLETSS